MKTLEHVTTLSLLVFIGFVVLPSYTHASVQITEIMYDVSGSDTGREWIEITNTGTSAVDVSGFKFFEANTNHSLTLTAGSSVLQPGTSALIINDITKFALDWPTFVGTLLKSSFSLSNTGETLILKDGTLAVQDTATYDSSMGADDNGDSLHRSSVTFVPAIPSPGIYSQGSGQPSSQTNNSVIASQSTSTLQVLQTSGSISLSSITANIVTDTVVMVGGGSFFYGQAFGIKGLPVQNARFLWNFGDGTTAEGQTILHAYSYPGKYVVLLDVGYEFSAGSDRVVVNAVPAQVLLIAEADNSLTIFNMSKIDMDIGLWSLSCGANSTFVIPKDTMVLASNGVRFSEHVTRLLCGVDAKLLYPNGAVASVADPSADSPLRGEVIITKVGKVSAVNSNIESKTIIAKSNVYKKRRVPTATVTEFENTTDKKSSITAGVLGGLSTPLAMPLLGLGALLVFGVASVLYMRVENYSPQSKNAEDETDSLVDEFKIE